jgi:AGZA family xanthine/uracil permease-like MFS transporter
MDRGALVTATALASALMTAVFALATNYPIALAPGMGMNAFFTYTLCLGLKVPWPAALGLVFLSGAIFLALTVAGIRRRIIEALPPELKTAISCGIGLFIAFIGLQNTGLIVKDPGTAVKLNAHFGSPDLVVFFVGLLVTAVLHARKVRGSILWGMVAATTLAAGLKLVLPLMPSAITAAPEVRDSMLLTRFQFAHAIVAAPPSLAPTLWKLDLLHALSPKMLPFVFVFLFMLVFDAIGTLVGVCEQAGFMKENRLPRARQAMVSDAVGTVAGAALGTSTVTSFIESAAGVEQGGRTGLTGLVVAALFLMALFFTPLIAMVATYPPITAPALVIIGALMTQNVSKIDWADFTESVPAFLTMIGIPLSYSIADGLALGFICYPLIKLFSGKFRGVSWLTCALALMLVAYFVFLRGRL